MRSEGRLMRSLVLAYVVTLPLSVISPRALGADSNASPSLAELSNPEWIATGRTKFVQTCAYCHGQEGDSGKVRPFRERSGWDPQIIHDTIANGRQRGANIMPSWKDSIPDDMIWKLVAYIHSLEGKPR